LKFEAQDKMPPMGKRDWLADMYGEDDLVFEAALSDVNCAIEKFLGIAYPEGKMLIS
jgi:hypothetical protein